MLQNFSMSKKLSILPFRSDLAPLFKNINEEWIRDMFQLESKDNKILENPQTEIIEKGGHILFVEDEQFGIVGTVALLKTGDSEYELTKMGVLKKARGRKAGEFLLSAIIEKAKHIKAKKLYLLTNRKCESAIHLYEKKGFYHDSGIMKQFGAQYDRCDVAMNFKNLD